MVFYQKVKVYPNSKRDYLDAPGIDSDGKPYMRIRLRQPAEDGKANAALIHFLSEILSLTQKDIKIINGYKSAWKVCEISNMDKDIFDKLIAKIHEPLHVTIPLKFDDVSGDANTG